ncbi:hypothetical protein JCM14469_25720 [Desulfatiferula olefinivorans]
MLASRILTHLSVQERMWTPSDLIRYVRDQSGLDYRRSRRLIDDLIRDNQLEYLDLYGRTCVGLSFNRKVRVSSRIVLCPPEIRVDAARTEVVIRLNKGISFGRGTHPTTRLCLAALDEVSTRKRFNHALDVGTGTGVLAVAMALLGAELVLGTDIDAVARNEADENVRLNALEHRILIDDTIPPEMCFDLIAANLRFPTLIDMGRFFRDRLTPDGVLVISGFRVEEKGQLISRYDRLGMTPSGETCENGWCALELGHSKNTPI